MELDQALEMAEALTLDNENAISTLGDGGDEVAELLFEEIKRLRDNREIINLAMKQRDDETIFFDPRIATEAYLQDQLKELHSLIIKEST